MFRALKSIAVVAAVALQPSPPASAVSPHPAGPDAGSAGGVMQVVAHQDDDLFFMNPDVSRSIAVGTPSVTVYLTAGEITGDGMSDSERARNRQRGAQNAYAAMAGVADDDDTTQHEWDGEAWQVGGKTIERYQLRAQPRIQLVFLNLPDGSLKSVNAGASKDTVVPLGGLVASPSRYTRSDTVATLQSILDAYQPVLLRTQDAEPDQRISSTTSILGPSHPDHVNGGLLAREAAAKHQGPLYEVSYRDYNTTDVRPNLAPADVTSKTSILERYFDFDRGFQRSRLGDPWLDRQYHRWSRGTDWATVDAAGRLVAFVVRNGQVQQYTRTTTGNWSGAGSLSVAGGPLAPGIAVGHEADGRLAVFGHRLSDHHVVVLRQSTLDGQFQTSWTDLGRPDPETSSRELTGTPVVASDGDGRLALFVRNARDGVSTLTQSEPSGSWDTAAWTTLPGREVQDGLSVVASQEHGIDLFASTKTKLLHWKQNRTSGTLQLDSSFPTVPTAGPPHAVLDAAGRVQVGYLQPGTGDLKLIQQTQPDGAIWDTPISLGETGETTQLAMTLVPAGQTGQDGRVMVVARNRSSGISASISGQDAGRESWTDLGGNTFDQPTVVTGPGGEVTILLVGPAGVSAGRVSLTGDRPSVGSWSALAP